jgi:hypothetical protein
MRHWPGAVPREARMLRSLLVGVVGEEGSWTG